MPNILYRTSTTPTVPVSSSAKGAALSNLEIDGNFKELSNQIDLKATIDAPTFTGVPLAPTAAVNSNTMQIATTAHVFAERTNAATLTNKTLTSPTINTPNISAPTITGISVAPTAAANTNTTQLATTAHVFAERTNAATLTNKSLTTPIITNPENTQQTLTDAATTTWDMNGGHVARWILGASRTLAAPTNIKVGGQYVLFIGLSNSAYTVTWPTNIVFPYGTPPDLSTSSWTVITLVWSVDHGKLLGSYTPGY